MITKGVSDIKGVSSLNTRPGPVTESRGLLKLYKLATEKENLLKKLEWANRQGAQARRRLSEIARGMHTMKRVVEEKAKKEPTPSSSDGLRSKFLKY